MILEKTDIQKIAEQLLKGKIGAMPTDTIYGIHCLANSPKLVEKVNIIKGRPKNMPYITLISNISDLKLFGVYPNSFEKKQIQKYWPGPNTLILENNKGETKGFRLPLNDFLIKLLCITGPLISTSANPHGLPVKNNIVETKEYFDNKIDFYVGGGTLSNPPSSIYKIEENKTTKIR